MKSELLKKVAESWEELENHPGYGISNPEYIATLTKENDLYIINKETNIVLLEIKDDRTILNHDVIPRHGGYSYFWEKRIEIFQKGLEKRLGHTVDVHKKETYDLYQKVDEAVKEIKKHGPHQEAAKEFMTLYGTRDNVYVYDCGTIVFEMKGTKKLINRYKILSINPEWEGIVKTFASILEEKLGNKIRVKDKGVFA